VTAADRTVVLAAVIGAHGVRGEVRLKAFSDDLVRYRAFDAGGRTLTLVSVRDGPNGAVARFAEVGDRTAAEALRGLALSVPRDALPPLEDGEYYHADLIGAEARSSGGEALGRIVGVENHGAGDLIEVERDGGRRFLVPVGAGVDDLGPPVIVNAAFVEK
jgi:16S rRNA processing protein RimM